MFFVGAGFRGRGLRWTGRLTVTEFTPITQWMARENLEKRSIWKMQINGVMKEDMWSFGFRWFIEFGVRFCKGGKFFGFWILVPEKKNSDRESKCYLYIVKFLIPQVIIFVGSRWLFLMSILLLETVLSFDETILIVMCCCLLQP